MGKSVEIIGCGQIQLQCQGQNEIYSSSTIATWKIVFLQVYKY